MKSPFVFILVLLVSFFAKAQQKNFIDQPYLETIATADTLIAPDRIYISIGLNESDSKNKKSVEEMERTMEATLKSIGINTEKDLSLMQLGSDFKKYLLSGQNIVKSKMYSLLVRDAITAGKVLTELERAGLANVNIESIEYSKTEEVLLFLKQRAVIKAKQAAIKMAQPLNQKPGRAIFISDVNDAGANQGRTNNNIVLRGAGSIYGSRANDMPPMYTEFKKLKFEVNVKVKFALE
nr:SIMPL domain-containing protein [uncultured Flavobacterium sp.]